MQIFLLTFIVHLADHVRAQCSGFYVFIFLLSSDSYSQEIGPFQGSSPSGVSTLQESETFVSAFDCPYTITATAVATIGNGTFQAGVLTYTLPEESLITFNYPGVTLSTIASGQVITIVCEPSSRNYINDFSRIGVQVAFLVPHPSLLHRFPTRILSCLFTHH
jgi:hypothetical protein